jgi:glycosyltransferase involved in cell wall biosynthesis
MISVIIPSLGRTKELVNCLKDLSQLALPEMEVIVVDQTIGRISAIMPSGFNYIFRHLALNEPNASLARNIGLYEARHPIVLFLDDDVRIENPNFLLNHLRHYEDPSIPGVYGQVLEVGQEPTDLPEPHEIETDWGWQQLPPNYSRPCRTRNGGAGNLSVRRDWALAVGGMDAWFEKGARREETEFNLRYTKFYGPLLFDPEAGLVHLSAGGGSRAWGHVKRTVPMHHITGHWYFYIRVLCDNTLGSRGLANELRFIAIALLKNPQAGKNAPLYLLNAARAVWGFGVALSRFAQGPNRLDKLNKYHYQDFHDVYVE